MSALSLLTVTAYADPTIVGNYNCQRTDATGSTSSLPLTVSQTGDTFTFQWNNANGYPTAYGTGVMTKSLNNMVSVVFWDAKDQNTYGNELFMMKPDGSLSANWTLQSDSKVGSENLHQELNPGHSRAINYNAASAQKDNFR